MSVCDMSVMKYTGQVVTALVREFLNFFDLDYTCSVFDPETNAVSCEKNMLHNSYSRVCEWLHNLQY